MLRFLLSFRFTTVAFGLLWASCESPVQKPDVGSTVEVPIADVKEQEVPMPALYTAPFPFDVRMEDYYRTVDSLVQLYCATVAEDLDEHVLILANPRIIDTLASFDYYRRMEQGDLIADQRKCIVFHKGDSLLIPDSLMTAAIVQRLSTTVLDLNIPEYRLRILEGSDTLYSFLVRVGRDEEKYLETAGHLVNLKTRQGKGQIVRVERNPYFVNPSTGKRYKGTTRDDGQYTTMPLIPWIEPTVNGMRYGQLIHPTTNESTLGKAYSHGCIGLSECDMWRVYYHAPIGTVVNFRYELLIKDANGDSVLLKDIYFERK
jgi:hypothetical protein